jgi:hypothetical protein
MNLEGKKFSKLIVIKKVGVKKGHSLWLCRCDCGKEIIRSQHSLCSKYLIKSCGCSIPKEAPIDLTGKRFGKLTVIGADKHNRSFWVCKCDCGNIKIVKGRYLRGNGCKSCGCAVKNKGLPGESGFNLMLSIYKKGAKKRGLEFTLSDEEFRELVIRNCYYCGSVPSRTMKKNSKYAAFVCNGIDRKDNSKGYTIENCVSCCGKCNRIKYVYNEEKFLTQCNLIARHHSPIVLPI